MDFSNKEDSMDIEIFLFFFVPFLFTYALMIGLGFLEIQILKHTFKVKDIILVILLKIFEIFFIFSDKINIKSLKILATLYFTVLIFYFCFKKITTKIFFIYILLFFVDLFFMHLILELGESIIIMPAF
ncbi:hypothetical protein FUSPEROL_01291 [Fusobacterium periodonticum ATCC 33693]|uniref:Uncharacterized protein n=2 Tax=Fusobacterium periodonticum TaxID=860 RepID=D4CV49_9FUSO|nr:hypothetical protein FUSPEROL_01291 [Fusobacterium periodonticum ATCC 33693]